MYHVLVLPCNVVISAELVLPVYTAPKLPAPDAVSRISYPAIGRSPALGTYHERCTPPAGIAVLTILVGALGADFAIVRVPGSALSLLPKSTA